MAGRHLHHRMATSALHSARPHSTCLVWCEQLSNRLQVAADGGRLCCGAQLHGPTLQAAAAAVVCKLDARHSHHPAAKGPQCTFRYQTSAAMHQLILSAQSFTEVYTDMTISLT